MKFHAKCNHNYGCSPGPCVDGPAVFTNGVESHPTGTGNAVLTVGWGGSHASGNTEEERKPTEEERIAGTHETFFTFVKSRCHTPPPCTGEFLSDLDREKSSILPAADKIEQVKWLSWGSLLLPHCCPGRDEGHLLKKQPSG